MSNPPSPLSLSAMSLDASPEWGGNLWSPDHSKICENALAVLPTSFIINNQVTPGPVRTECLIADGPHDDREEREWFAIHSDDLLALAGCSGCDAVGGCSVLGLFVGLFF